MKLGFKKFARDGEAKASGQAPAKLVVKLTPARDDVMHVVRDLRFHHFVAHQRESFFHDSR